MDWTKARNVLIFIFIILNIVLAVNLGITVYGGSTSTEILSDTKDILKDRGIELKCGIPVLKSDNVTVTYKRVEYDRLKIVKLLMGNVTDKLEKSGEDAVLSYGGKKLVFKGSGEMVYTDDKPSEPLAIDTREEAEKFLKKLINDMGLPGDNYFLSEYSRDSYGNISAIFIEKIKGLFIFDSKIEFKVNKNGLTKVRCDRPRGFTIKDRKAIPAYQMLLSNFNGDNKYVIGHIDFGIEGDESEKDSKEIIQNLKWKITLGDGSEKTFNASEGY